MEELRNELDVIDEEANEVDDCLENEAEVEAFEEHESHAGKVVLGVAAGVLLAIAANAAYKKARGWFKTFLLRKQAIEVEATEVTETEDDSVEKPE